MKSGNFLKNVAAPFFSESNVQFLPDPQNLILKIKLDINLVKLL